jgi:hypothetical protein
LFEQIRRDRRLEELSIRELAEKHGVHRRTVRQALAAPVPPPRRTYPTRAHPAIYPFAAVIDGWLLDDQNAPRKQDGDTAQALSLTPPSGVVARRACQPRLRKIGCR